MQYLVRREIHMTVTVEADSHEEAEHKASELDFPGGWDTCETEDEGAVELGPNT